MTSEVTKMWLDTYLADLNSMSAHQRAEESRENYYEEAQVDQDYLDYVEEWQWHTSQHEIELQSSVIRLLAARNLTLKCDCGTEHKLALHKQGRTDGHIIVDALNVMPHQQCWYRTTRRIVAEVLKSMDSESKTYDLPKTLVRTLTMVSRWRLVQMSQTPILLGIEAFRSLWWSLAETKKSTVAKEILEQITRADRQRVETEHRQAQSMISEDKHRILLHFPHSDHGFHALIRSLPEDQGRSVFRFINTQRAKIDPKARLYWSDLERKIRSCPLCQKGANTNLPKPWDFPMAVYYAPPGIGKTTTLDREKLIALDTDWIGVGPTWVDYSQIFQKGIPIITNQHTAFVGCGLKIVGLYNSSIREVDGKPLTTVTAIEDIYHQWSTEMFLIKIPIGSYFMDYLTHLFVYLTYQSLVENAVIRRTMPTDDDDPQWRKLYPKALRRVFL